ncbi:MAG: HDOD domain-containing protein [Phycisphaerales bacterium]|nr:MAG: HDOD domain-containing protein [Phycisphaerales bacterium]
MRETSLTAEEVVAHTSLPSLPAVAVLILDMTSNADAGPKEIVQVVQQDQVLSSRILRVVNSSFYDLSKPCASIAAAMAHLGSRTINSLALSFGLVDISRQADGGLDLTGYWRRCVHSAAAARRISLLTGTGDPEQCLLTGLSQDIGMLALHASLDAVYGRVVAKTRGDHSRLPEAEEEAFGFNHARIGSELAGRWRLPAYLADPIRHHHDAQMTAVGDRFLAAAVIMANHVASAIDKPDEDALRPLCSTASKLLGISPHQVKPLILESAVDASNLAGLLEVEIGAQPALIRAILARESVRAYSPRR